MPLLPSVSKPTKAFVDYKKKESIFGNFKFGQITGTVQEKVDTVLDKGVDRVLDALDGSVMAADPYMPGFLGNTVYGLKRQAWEEVKESLQEIVVESISWREKAYRKRRLRHWASNPKMLPHVFTWLRAKFLYSINPADGSKWKVLRDPIAVLFFFLTVFPLYAVHIWAFVFLFLFIDKRDEYQLVWFILKFKMTQALSTGTFLLAKFALFAYACLYHISLETDQDEMEEHRASTGYGSHWCADHAPGTDSMFPYEIAMEPVRMMLVWLAFFLLWCGHARGGRGELKALEHVRLDAADGALDGVTDTKALDRNFEMRTLGGKHDDRSYAKAAQSARLLYNAEVRLGGALRYFLLYDVAVVVLLALITMYLLQRGDYGPNNFIFWTSCYYVKMLYSLSASPFLIFAVPVVGPALHGARMTAYDKAGHLCPKLTLKQTSAKYAEDMGMGNQIDD